MTEPMIARVRAQAPVKKVWEALTDAAALRAWLSQHAEVNLPHQYEFWGRHTPEGDAPRQRIVEVGEHSLRFIWPVDGEDTTTEIRLTEEDATTTIITVSQSHYDFQDVITGASIRGVFETFWALSLSNLVDHVEGRELTSKLDFTSAEFRDELTIDAPIGEVYDSLTDSAKVTEWFGYPIGIEPREGGRFAMGGLANPEYAATIIKIEPGRSMSTDWGDFGVVSWELADSGGQTRLTFVQSGFNPKAPPYAGWGGWLSGLAALRRFHEVPHLRPIWLGAA